MGLMDSTVIADLENPFADWGQSATYTLESTGVAGSIQAIFSEKTDLDDAQWAAALQATAEVLVLESEVQAPVRNDTITIDSVIWTVANVVSLSGGLFTLNVYRDLRPTFRK
jgi:hypothetical protein